jgi:hypothetical protein
VSFITAIALDNIPIRRGAWLSTPASWGAAKTTPRFTQTGIPVLGDDDMLLGYPYLQTNQIPTGAVTNGDFVFFGSWPDLLVGLWEGVDLVVDPYTLAAQAQIRVVVNQFADLQVRYDQAFCVSSDAGAILLGKSAPKNAGNNK